MFLYIFCLFECSVLSRLVEQYLIYISLFYRRVVLCIPFHLSFDFFLPHFNTCVEYDGIQHFKPYGWDKSGSRFKSTQKNDGIKNEYCLKNDIKLVRIKYNDKINLKNILE